MKNYAHEHCIFVGLENMRDDNDVINSQISLGKLRYLIMETLNLHPFLPVLQKNLAKRIFQYQQQMILEKKLKAGISNLLKKNLMKKQ